VASSFSAGSSDIPRVVAVGYDFRGPPIEKADVATAANKRKRQIVVVKLLISTVLLLSCFQDELRS